MKKPKSDQVLNSWLPIKTKPWPGDKEHDLTDRELSKLTVKGYYGPSNDHGTAWVCQCVCGRYEVRRRKALKRQRPDRDYYCQECENEISLQTRYELLGWVAA